MGPRSADRGIACVMAAGDCISSWLQWGRDQLIAELDGSGYTRRGPFGFNGAAIS